MLLFSVHPEPEGRKVDKMLTLKKVKEMVKAPVHTKRVPSPKVLLEDGRILLRKEFEHDSHLTLYHSGYVWFSTGKRNTVFHIHDCRGDYAYDAAEGKGDVIEEEYFENCEWHIRALFEGERRVEESQQKCEGVGQTKVCVSYHAVAEDWGEMADSEINVLDDDPLRRPYFLHQYQFDLLAKPLFRLWPYQLRGGPMGKKLQKYLDEAEKTEQQIAELEERLRTIRAAQKKEEDSEIIRAIRSTKMGGRELLALLDNIQAGNVTFLTAVNNASGEAETEEAIEKDA